MAGISDPLSAYGPAAKAKFVILNPADFLSEKLMDWARSLNIEHVSPFRLPRPEISRRAASAVTEEDRQLAALRRWFFARKPDAGFVLTDFPATLLQAKVLDEWLEARDEALNAVFAGATTSGPIIEHYRTLGLLEEASRLPAAVRATGTPTSSAAEARP